MVQELSQAASRLLLEVSQDPGGLILRLATLAGRALLKTNGKTFADGTPSEQAQWESGVRQLLSRGLVEAHGDKAQVLSITDKGHQAANLLRDRR
jgi:RQC domain